MMTSRQLLKANVKKERSIAIPMVDGSRERKARKEQLERLKKTGEEKASDHELRRKRVDQLQQRMPRQGKSERVVPAFTVTVAEDEGGVTAGFLQAGGEAGRRRDG